MDDGTTCPECGWGVSDYEDKWVPDNTKIWFEKRSCMKCNHVFWVECWEIRNYEENEGYKMVSEFVDTSIVEGLRRAGGDGMPSPSELRGYWLR